MKQQSNIIRNLTHPNSIYGDGNQGAVVFDGSSTVLGLVPSGNVYTLTADVETLDFTVNSGVTIKLAGFVPRINGVFWNKGTVTGLQNDGSGSTAGAAISAVGSLGTTAAAGGAGRNTTGVGNNGTGAGSSNISGSASGKGGDADGVNTGGTGNNTVAPTAVLGKWRNLAYMIRGRLSNGTTAGNGSGGGGGGGCNVGTGTATSGGGGSGSIPVHIFCKYLKNEGTIHSNGGRGGNATATGNGKAGGGGGGAAGPVHIVTDAVIALGTITATGGVGGTGIGGGASGSNGTNSYYDIYLPQRTITG